MLRVHGAEVTCIAAAGSQSAPLPRTLVAVGTADGYVKLLDGQSGRPHSQVAPSAGVKDRPRLLAVDLAPGAGVLLAATSDHTLRLLDLRTQRLLHSLRGHRDALTSCGFFKGSTHAYTASVDRTVKVWDLERGQTLQSISGRTAIVCATAHQGLGLVVAGHADGTVAVWDSRTASQLSAPTPVQSTGVHGLALSPDGKVLLSQGSDGSVCTTALDGMRPLHSFKCPGLPAAKATAPGFSQDGRHALAVGADWLCCWEVSSGDEVAVHPTADSPCCLTWSLPHAVTAHSGGRVALWGDNISGTPGP